MKAQLTEAQNETELIKAKIEQIGEKLAEIIRRAEAIDDGRGVNQAWAWAIRQLQIERMYKAVRLMQEAHFLI